jgi:hypothetical protein
MMGGGDSNSNTDEGTLSGTGEVIEDVSVQSSKRSKASSEKDPERE